MAIWYNLMPGHDFMLGANVVTRGNVTLVHSFFEADNAMHYA